MRKDERAEEPLPHADPPATGWRRWRGSRSLYAEVAFVVAITSVGAFIRLWHLTTLPYGFHNDEGNIVLDATRILDEGWIGPYSFLALGYPIAVNYYVAPFIEVFGETVFAVRLAMALLGIASIPLAYGTFRLAGGWRVAVCGSILFTFSLWHLHLSRVGFPVIGWSFVEVGSLLLLALGLKTRQWPYFVSAGLLIGVGLWVYNSVFLFAAAVAIWLTIWMVVRLASRRDLIALKELVLLTILLLSTLFAAWPLIEYALDDKNNYQGHFKSVYIFQRPEYERYNTLGERIDLTWENMNNFYDYLTTVPHGDGADAIGVIPPVGKVAMYLAFIGFALALWRLGNAALGIGLLAVPLIWIAPAITIDGQFRRSFGLMPFLAMFGGLALGVAWEWADKQWMVIRAGVLALIVLLLGGVVERTLDFYFGGDFERDSLTRFVFFPEMRAASEYVQSRPGSPYVYFYSERASLGHESRRVLASEIAGGEERSAEFKPDKDPVRFDLAPGSGPSFPARVKPEGAVFLFFGRYLMDLEKVAERYPGGEVEEKFSEQYRTFDFRAYYLPPDLLDLYARREGVSFPIQPLP